MNKSSLLVVQIILFTTYSLIVFLMAAYFIVVFIVVGFCIQDEGRVW
jgi:hypothetical protein